jgi:hypothetical protein
MLSQDAPAKRIALAHCYSAYPSGFSRQIKAAGVQMPENKDRAVIVSGI